MKTPQAALPDFRNLGVLLRALVLAEGLRLVVWWVREPGWDTWWSGYVEQALLYEPVLLTAVLLLYWWQPWLAQTSYARGCAAVMAVAALSAVGWHTAVTWGLSLALPVTAWHSATVAALVAGAVLFYFNWRHHRLSPALAEARVTALQARIRPHFLFNSLNSAMALLRTQPRQAEAVLQDLADLYRALLSDARVLVPLAQELQLAKAYVDIERVRLGDRLRMHWLTHNAPQDALVPPLLLQPLLENAVRYGVEPAPGGADVTLEIYAEDDRLLIFVRNDLPPQPLGAVAGGNHMALGNIRERLELHFDAEAQLKRHTTEREHVVTVRIPRRRR
ncbi:sensor histidine kinase [Tepidicella baoligensis]|uniref:sensor histidine kinase n=1 Tax=Tepidicella baoligensis TaxID=2707016 RepID=UPI0015DABF6B|nr:sensor histidine kinase [Tepidicella baoligensis]